MACKKIFIAATGQHCGKTTISLSLMHLARKKYDRVGFVKPIGPKCIVFNGLTMDMDAAMMASVYSLESDAHLMSPMTLTPGSTREYLDSRIAPETPRTLITGAIRELEQRYDFLIIEGAGHGGVGSVVGANNAQVATMVGAPVLMVTNGGIGNVIDAVELNLALYEREKADVRVIMVNKLVPEKRERSLAYLRKAFAGTGMLVTSAFDYSPILAHPTLQHVAEMLGLQLKGNPADKSRICHTIQLGAASSQRVIDHLEDATLLIVTSSRDELIVTTSSLYNISDFKKRLAGLVISGHAPMSRITQQILADSGIPYMRIEETSSEVFYRLKEHVSKIGPDDLEKIELINSISERCIDFKTIDALL
jgi:BioD-like phosphotransacetylase family protein